MDILKLLLNSGVSKDVIEAMSQKSGLNPSSVEDVVAKIAPIFMQKANENFKSDADSSNLIDLIKRSNLETISKDPAQIDISQGNDLLGIFTGSKDNSRALANDVGSKLGIDANSIKALLPMIAPVVAGMLNKQVQASNLSGSADNNSIVPLLTKFLDQNKDGSILDDVLRMAGNFFGKK